MGRGERIRAQTVRELGGTGVRAHSAKRRSEPLADIRPADEGDVLLRQWHDHADPLTCFCVKIGLNVAWHKRFRLIYRV